LTLCLSQRTTNRRTVSSGGSNISNFAILWRYAGSQKAGGALSGFSDATRAQVAAIVQRFMEKTAK
jgi:hypothetical protein